MQLDLNADLGEALSDSGPVDRARGDSSPTMGDDQALLGIVTSANIACGFHAGDPVVMQNTCTAAVEHGVVIGAHVSYLDRAGFGRVPMDVPPDRLYADVSYQISALSGMARSAGGQVRYVKPHGALYNTIIRDQKQAGAVVAAVAARGLVLLTQPGAAANLAEQQGVAVAFEAFADRAYTAAGTLVPRSQPGAVLDDVDEIVARVLHFAATGNLPTIDGDQVQVPARSICVHGDTPGSVGIARAVRAALIGQGEVRPFAP